MTVLTETTKVTGSGNGSATLFSFSPIQIYDEDDLEFYIISPAGVETQINRGTGPNAFAVVVTLAANRSATGSIQYPEDQVTPLPSGWSYVIRRKVPFTQTVALRNQGGYLPQVQEEVFDRLVMSTLQIQEELDRAPKVLIGSATDVDTLTANINNLAGIQSDITTVAGISANVTTVAGDTANIATVVTNIANINTVAGSISNVNTVATNDANITIVADDITNVNTVATNITGVNSFAERYRVGATDPISDLNEGDLFYNTTANVLKYYNGAAWETVQAADVSAAGNNTWTGTNHFEGAVTLDAPTLGGNMSGASTHKLVNMADGTDAQDYVTKAQLDGIQSGGWVPLQTQTVGTAVASVDFTSGIDGTYKAYAVVFEGMKQTTGNQIVNIRVGNDGVFDSSGYGYAGIRVLSSGSTVSGVASASASAIDTQANTGSSTALSASGLIKLFSFSDSSSNSNIEYDISFGSGSTPIGTCRGSGTRIEAAIHDRIQIYWNSGNITAGTFTLYGLAGA